MPKLVQRSFFAVCALILLTSLAARAQGRVIYSDTADAHHDIAQAIVTAHHEHKRIILDFGGNWCIDCQVLDIYFHQPPNLELLQDNFVLVHVDIGHYDRNADVAAKYGIPLEHGVPKLAVLDDQGRLLYGQVKGEFKSMSKMDASSVTQFLNQWKPKAKA